jgi:DNA-binding GntR family transcriptional regulator
MKKISTIKVKTVQKTVYNILRDAIMNGDLAPGEQLSLTEIADSLKVSTMPVREALRQLEAQGLVTFTSQKKIHVTQLSVEDLAEFYWIRIPLECRSFARNFEKLQEKHIEKLKELHHRMCVDGVNGTEWATLNREFHMILYGADKSHVLNSALAWLWNNVSPYLSIYAQTSAVSDANIVHAKIIEAIVEKDINKAIQLLKGHLRTGLTVVGPYLNKMDAGLESSSETGKLDLFDAESD